MPSRDLFKKMVVAHGLQEKEGLLALNIAKLFPNLVDSINVNSNPAQAPAASEDHENEYDNEPPSFDLGFGHILNKPLIVKVYMKIFEAMKWEMYQRIKEVTEHRE